MSAWGQASSIEINTTNSGVTGSYQDKEFEVDDITFKFTQWMKSTNIQAKKSTTNSLYNIDAIPGTITSIVVEQTGTARAITIYGGTSQKPTTPITSPSTAATMTFDFTGTNYNYFSLSTPGNACYFEKIIINYTPSGDIPTPTYTVTYNANGGSGTMTDENSPYEKDAEVTLLSNSFTAPEGQLWDSWLVKDESNNPITVTGNKFNMPASNVTVTAQWKTDPNAPQYEWVLTDLASLTDEDVFVIVGNSSYAMTNNNGTTNPPAATSVTISEGKITSTISDNLKWKISGNATAGYTFYPNGSSSSWLYCNTEANTSSNNNMRVGTGGRKVFELNSGNYLITKDEYTVRYLSIYNNTDWRGYINTDNGVATMSFYKRVDANAPQSPSISANNVDIAYNATSGSINYSLANGVTGGTLSANITAGNEGNWLTLGTVGETVPFTCTANEANTERTATVTLTYSYGDNETVTKDVTVTQAAAPVISSYSTIPEIFEAATSTETDVNVTFNNWVVSGVSTNGKNVFVTDGTNGFIIFSSSNMSSTYSVGSVLSGTVSCTLKKYNGFAELLNVDASKLTITAGGTVSVANIAIANLAGVNTGALVSYENLTCSIDNNKYYLSDGTSTLQVYNTLYAFDALESGKTYNITGIYQQYNSTKEILPRSAEEIELVVSTDPTLTVDNADKTINVDAAGTITNHEEQTIKVKFANFTTAPTTSTVYVEYCDADGKALVTSGYDWITSITCNRVSDGYLTMSCSFAANTGKARTAYVKVYAVNNNVNIYSDLVTVKQAGNIVDDISDITEVSTDYAVRGTVVATNSRGFIIGDGTGYVYYYKNAAFTQAVGDMVKISGTTGTYGQIIQFTNTATVAESTESNYDNTPAVEVITAVPDYTTGYHLSTYLEFEGALSTSDNNYLITLGDKQIQISYPTTAQVTALSTLVGKTVHVKGYFSGINSKGKFSVMLESVGEVVTIPESKYTTFASTANIDFNGTGVTVYIAKAENGAAKLAAVRGNIAPANTGVILYAEEAGNYAGTIIGSTDVSITDNDMVGVTTEKVVPWTSGSKYNYILQGGVFKKATGAKLHAGKAYLSTDYQATSRELQIVFEGEDEATGIADVKGQKEEGGFFNLSGQRVTKPTKGLYIINGKKMIVK